MPSAELIIEYLIMQAILTLGFLAAWKRKPIYNRLRQGAVYALLWWRQKTYQEKQ